MKKETKFSIKPLISIIIFILFMLILTFNNYEDFETYLNQYGILLLFLLFLFCICIYNIAKHFINKFIIRKNKKRKEKNKNYFADLYTPFINFYDHYMLITLYFIAAVSLLIIVFSRNLFISLIEIIPILLIIYDLIYKLKLKKEMQKIEQIQDENIKQIEFDNIDNSLELSKFKATTLNLIRYMWYLIQFVVSCILIFIFIWLFINSSDHISRMFIVPFIISSFISLGLVISSFFRKIDWELLLNKLFIVIFLLFWFGFLIIATYISLINKEYSIVLFSIPFWIVGIFTIYKNFIKKK